MLIRGLRLRFKCSKALVRRLDKAFQLGSETIYSCGELRQFFGQFEQFARQQPRTHGLEPLGIFVQNLHQVFYGIDRVHVSSFFASI